MNVNSTMIAAVDRARADLLVRFNNGWTYRYTGAGFLMPQVTRVADAGESVGKWFNEHVKDVYPTTKMGFTSPDFRPDDLEGMRDV